MNYLVSALFLVVKYALRRTINNPVGMVFEKISISQENSSGKGVRVRVFKESP